MRNLPAATLRIGSHSKSHRFLNALPEIEIYSELKTSKEILEEIVGYTVDSISIPNGAVDRRVLRIAAEVGYRYIFTSAPGWNQQTVDHRARGIHRMAVRRSTSPATLNQWLTSSLWRERLRHQLLEFPKRLLGPQNYRRLRCRLCGESVDQFTIPSAQAEETVTLKM